MLAIFKWFFGIIGAIILVYVLIVMIRSVLTATSGTINAVASSTNSTSTISSTTNFSNFSLASWLYNFHPFTFSPLYVGYDARNSQPPFFDENGNYQTQDQLYWQNINNAPNDHPTDWIPQNSTDYNGDFDLRWGGGTSYLNNSNNLDFKLDFKGDARYIKVNLQENSYIKNNQVISGRVFYKVFMDGYFPLYILDGNGEVLGSAKAFVNGNLDQNGFVPFRAVISYDVGNTRNGYLMFKNENQDLAKINAVTIIPIFFRENYIQQQMPQLLYTSPADPLRNNCVVSGCSQQFCTDQATAVNTVSTCEWRPAYACYQHAVCERSTDTGQCGWKMDGTLARCLQNSN